MSVAELHQGAPGFERTPPQDISAEQSVLGGMLMSKDAIADVVEVIRSHDFYRPAHQTIYDTILDLYGRGEPADPVTIAAELTKRGEIARVGGAPYLHTLIASVPTAANAGYYARIVRERAILRRLVEAGTRIVQMGYAVDGAEVDDVVDRAQAEVYSVTERRTSDDYLPLAEIMEGALDEIDAIASHGGRLIGVPTGFADLDQLTNGLHPGQMVIVAARPALGKSTLGLDFARSASIKHGLTSVIFSLEMSRNEITMRLLSAEARVALHHMRSGTMTDDDWTRLARRMGEVSSAPLFIDDSPNMSMMEIRAKCRRLRQRHDLRLVIVDYMQLMQSPRRIESRQQEVSEMSRGLKLLAKELEVPVVAISQLNRGPEQRTDKKPMLADLRESGCMTADTALLRADTGAPITFRDLLDRGHHGVFVWSFDEHRRLVPAAVINVFLSGVKEVYRLKLASGREVKATGNHPFLTTHGWAPLDTLHVGDRIAIPCRTPEPLKAGLGWSEHRLRLLAHLLLGDGCIRRQQPVHYRSGNEANLASVEAAAAAEFGITPRRVQEGNRWHTYLPPPGDSADGRSHPLRVWFRDLGIDDLRSYEKRIPDVLYSASNSELAMFLQHLWATDGNLVPKPGTKTVSKSLSASPSSISERRIRRDAGRREPARGLPSGSKVCYSTSSRDLAEGVVLLLSRFGILARFTAVAEAQHLPSYVIAALDSDLQAAEAGDDAFWDPIIAVEPLGARPVFDATVAGTHNFIADGIAAHNSLEQDADVVILLHREDAYERESPRAGEADLIVAKHRNGPTATVTVAFQGHYSRFVDMAQI